MSQHIERIDPIPERVGKGMFTDREREMDSLMEWSGWVADNVGKSRALVSHRRHGKTAIMERFYNRLFWERDDVMPFYFELGERKIWLWELVRRYLFTFLQQFLAYRPRDAMLAFRPTTFEELHALAEKADEKLVVEAIDHWNKINDSGYTTDIEEIFCNYPHYFASRAGLSIIVMFDEFQRLDQVVYEDEERANQSPPLTGSFATAAESSQAPMLIAGSQVTILTQQALWGAMMGRVGLDRIKRLDTDGAVKLVRKFARQHKLEISQEMAYQMSKLVDGHPYYIWCLFHSHCLVRDFTSEEGIKAVLAFEIEDPSGYINIFWQYHFLQNMETINLPHARKLIFYLSQYPKTEVHLDQIVADLALPLSVEDASVEEVNETLRRLIWCDLIRKRGDDFYGGLSDPMLGRIVLLEYSWEIGQLKRDEALARIQDEFTQELAVAHSEIARLRGELSNWVGRFAEMFIDRLMKLHFKGEVVDGADYFNGTGEVFLAPFSQVFNTMTQPPGAPRPYQIDLYGIPQDDNQLPWIVEVKNWGKPVGKREVEHFWAAAQNLARERDHEEFICWFYARSDFSGPAEAFLREKGMLYSDAVRLEKLLRALGVADDGAE